MHSALTPWRVALPRVSERKSQLPLRLRARAILGACGATLIVPEKLHETPRLRRHIRPQAAYGSGRPELRRLAQDFPTCGPSAQTTQGPEVQPRFACVRLARR